MRQLSCWNLALLFLALSLASGENFTLRVVNPKSGKPLSKVPVTMFYWNGPPTYSPDAVPKEQIVIHATTDADGVASFALSEPHREHVGFSIGTPWDLAGCWHLKAVSPDVIRQSGTVADYDEKKCGKLKQQGVAKPGEVLIFERRLTTVEKARREVP